MDFVQMFIEMSWKFFIYLSENSELKKATALSW